VNRLRGKNKRVLAVTARVVPVLEGDEPREFNFVHTAMQSSYHTDNLFVTPPRLISVSKDEGESRIPFYLTRGSLSIG
jgi:hypothetical protein